MVQANKGECKAHPHHLSFYDDGCDAKSDQDSLKIKRRAVCTALSLFITKNGYACWLVTQQPDCYLMGTAIWVM